jgi:tricorn protease
VHKTILTIILLTAAAGGARVAGKEPLLLQKPTLSKTHVAFCFAGDLWIVSRDGGEARRLTSGVGVETDPVFSPNGSLIAFTGEYDGNLDVYVVPAAGGEPRRLTYHPGVDLALGWTPDGKNVFFASIRTSYSRFTKLFTIPLVGGTLPTELPLPMGVEGAFSPDGSHLAYVPFRNPLIGPGDYLAWKHYRGGKASPIWIASLADSKIDKVPRTDSNDSCPMWLGGKVYFLSDRDGPVTLYCFNPESREVKQVFENKGYDLVSASAGPDAIVCEQFGSLLIFDPNSGTAKGVDVKITADFPAARPHYVNVGKQIRAAAISPTGARAVFEARGDILTVPADKGDVRNLTGTSSAVERDPAWSPDGKTIAYFSDESGEYMLHLRDDRGETPARRIALGESPNYYFNPVWSPDSMRIAYSDNRGQLWVLEVASGKSVKVDRNVYHDVDFDSAWSPDSRWLVYTRILANRLRIACLFDTATRKTCAITDGMSDVRFPVFDKGGKYLFFTASTDVGPAVSVMDLSGFNRPVSRSVYLAVLAADTPSPLAHESDEEKSSDAIPSGSDLPSAADADKKKGEIRPTKIDLEDIDHRMLPLPVPARNYVGLVAGQAGKLLLLERAAVPNLEYSEPQANPTTVTRFDLGKRRSEKLVDGVGQVDVSVTGEKMLYQQGGKWFIVSLAGDLPKPEKPLRTGDMEVRIDPRAEWKQMYREAWRLQRVFLYDPHAHGLDLAAAEKKYEVFLDGIAHRADLNYLFNEMLGNLVLGHTFILGGDAPEAPKVKGGLLGADWTIDNGHYRFARIYTGESWNPHSRAPLAQPGARVKEGDYLLAVNGKEMKSTDNIYRAFESTADKAVTIKVAPEPDGTGARDITIVPVDSERVLRNLAWMEDNRRKVDKLSGGKVAYVYLPSTQMEGYKAFNRYFFAQVDKEGLVIDERFNGGGKAPDYVIDYLRRPLLNYWATREGEIQATPAGAIFGPKAMIINEFAASGGDALPWYFSKTGVGCLVGKRTWGGLVGTFGYYPPLLDGGTVTVPVFAFFSPDGTWDVENHGVAPDVEVEYDPYKVRQGHDPQLEKAVEVVLEALKKNPPTQPKRPAYPDYYKSPPAGRVKATTSRR